VHYGEYIGQIAQQNRDNLMNNDKGNAYKINRTDTPTHTAGSLKGTEFLEPLGWVVVCVECDVSNLELDECPNSMGDTCNACCDCEVRDNH
jgi:hypothetical protein